MGLGMIFELNHGDYMVKETSVLKSFQSISATALIMDSKVILRADIEIYTKGVYYRPCSSPYIGSLASYSWLTSDIEHSSCGTYFGLKGVPPSLLGALCMYCSGTRTLLV